MTAAVEDDGSTGGQSTGGSSTGQSSASSTGSSTTDQADSGPAFTVEHCQYSVSSTAVDFGSVGVGSTSQPMTFAIQNLGTTVCALQDLDIQNDATGSFHILSTSLPPESPNVILLPPPDAGATSSLVVTMDFAPSILVASLTADAVVSVLDPSGMDDTVSASLSGATPAPDYSHCIDVPTSLALGDTEWPPENGGVICASASRTFSLFNHCAIDVTVLSFTLQNGPGDSVPQFSLPGGPPLPLSLPAGSTAAIYEILFEPTSAGTHTAELVMTYETADSLSTQQSTISLSAQTTGPGHETDSFVATTSLSYPLVSTPLNGQNGITVTLNGTPVAQLDGPDDPDWTYDASSNAIVFTPRVYLMAGGSISVTYPISCR